MCLFEEWGGLLKRGWKAIPLVFIDNCMKLNISIGEAWFIVIAHGFTNGDNYICPKIDSIAKKMGKSKDSIKNYIRSLRKAGLLITIQKQYYQEYDFSPLYSKLRNLDIKCLK